MQCNLFNRQSLLILTCLRGFKALKQATKLLYNVLHRPDEALETYTELLTYTRTAVTRNYAEKSINSILDYVGGGAGGAINVNVLEKFYQVTLDALIEARNEASTSTSLFYYACLIF